MRIRTTMYPVLAVVLLAAQVPTGCVPKAPIQPATSAPYDATVALAFDQPGRAVNRLVLGSNVQWADGGDHLVPAAGAAFDATLLGTVKAMGPTILRYPGGSHSDLYHWRDGITAPAARGQSEHFYSKQMQPIRFGTPELMALAREVNGEALLTVNTATGTPAEAADWVRQMNITRLNDASGKPFPTVKYWEVGNEPYLNLENQPRLHVAPAEFARRADEIIRAMRAADPSISIGIPLRSDQVGAINLPQAVKGYAAAVLGGVKERYDWVAVHNAYFPFLWNPKAGLQPAEVFAAMMAAPATVEADLGETRRLLDRYAPGRGVKIGITEYNALVGFTGREAEWTSSLAAALYVSDLLRVFASREDVVMANYWSLSGNGWFGAVTGWDGRRPQSWVLEGWNGLLRGRVAPATVTAPTFDAPAAGLLAATRGQAQLTSFATVDGTRGQAMLINKSWGGIARVTLRAGAARLTRVRVLHSPEPFGGAATWKALRWAPAALPAAGAPLEVPAHAMVLLEFDLPAGAARD